MITSQKNISFRIDTQTNQSIKYFVYKNKKYPVNFDLLKKNCNYFYQNRKQFKDIDDIVLVNEEDERDIELTEDSITAFISNCQNDNCQICLSSVIPLNYLACKYDYPALKNYTDNLIRENSNELIFQKLLFKIDESKNEEFIAANISQYIEDDRIFALQLSTIERIIQISKKIETFQKVDSQKNDELFVYMS
ncbi:hypothetical protein M9Y10_008854 [Tritrichomonas musculus]|uniref:Uncharacterized protein n=1 Tax=Tritrichomonas musculus TaxID=1915356 RepID=A0ABR2J077_9EUKA